VTYQSRLTLACALAVAIAILLASSIAYVLDQNSLIGSIDSSLSSRVSAALSQGVIDHDAVFGDIAAIWLPGAIGSSTVDPLPVTNAVREVASGRRGAYFTDIVVSHHDYREYVTPVAAGLFVSGFGDLPSNGALQMAASLESVGAQLSILRVELLVVAISGIAIAIGLGLLISRRMVSPLKVLTRRVETMSESLNVSKRLDVGTLDELGRLRRAFNLLLAALQKSQVAQTQLVLDASHELRTPITSLRTNLEVSARMAELPEEDQGLLRADMLSQLEELSQVVSDITELARGDVDLRPPEVFRLDVLVSEVISLANTHARTRGIDILGALEESMVSARRERVGRAISNLVDNAIKWSPDDGTVRITSRSGSVVVADEGPGISPNDLPYIFDRFYRSAAARALPGSGLGLSIVAQVADEEGGQMAVGADEKIGAIFTFALPAWDGSEEPKGPSI
jgi:two-component system sensor histidine kinase MprB